MPDDHLWLKHMYVQALVHMYTHEHMCISHTRKHFGLQKLLQEKVNLNKVCSTKPE